MDFAHFFDIAARVLLGLCVLLFVALCVSFPSAIRESNKFKRDCDAKGGTVIHIRGDGYRCFAKGVVL